ncbi:MAG: hypothetical protein ABIJ09_24830 [Pseudomonadota bacterium]
MERLSTLVIQKLLDGFFLGLDVIDDTRRRIDRLMGRPTEEPFEVVWPEPEAPPSAPPPAPQQRAESAPTAPPAGSEHRASPKAKNSKGAKTAARARPSVAKKDSGSRPKVTMEIEDLADKIKKGALAARQIGADDELAGKRMIARVVYVLGAAEEQDLGALTSTEVAHVLTVGLGIETFGTNISRAIRQGTGGMVEARLTDPKDTNRFALTDKGRDAYRSYFARGA